MADDYTVIPVGNLQLADTMKANDTLIAEQGGYARRLPASLFKGEKGDPGADGTMTFEDLTDEQKASLKGDTGPQGPAGESPTISAVRVTDGVSITVQNVGGEAQTVVVADGADGESPTLEASATTLPYGADATVTISAGITADYLVAFGIPQGKDGTMSFEDLTPEQIDDLKGDPGPQGEKGDPFTYSDFTAAQLEALRGPQGATGPGVASGGTAGQVLVKGSAANYDTAWANMPSGTLPVVTSADNGKVLAVVNGQWAAVDIRALLGQYVFDYDSATNTLDITTEVS